MFYRSVRLVSSVSSDSIYKCCFSFWVFSHYTNIDVTVVRVGGALCISACAPFVANSSMMRRPSAVPFKRVLGVFFYSHFAVEAFLQLERSFFLVSLVNVALGEKVFSLVRCYFPRRVRLGDCCFDLCLLWLRLPSFVRR